MSFDLRLIRKAFGITQGLFRRIVADNSFPRQDVTHLRNEFGVWGTSDANLMLSISALSAYYKLAMPLELNQKIRTSVQPDKETECGRQIAFVLIISKTQI